MAYSRASARCNPLPVDRTQPILEGSAVAHQLEQTFETVAGTHGCVKGMMTIYVYSQTDPFGELSNFAPFGVEIDGLWWPTVEHYFQARKFEDAV